MHQKTGPRAPAVAFVSLLAGTLSGLSGGGTTLSAQVDTTSVDYARAESLLGWNLESRVLGIPDTPEFIGDSDDFWYEVNGADGAAWYLVSPTQATRAPLFDKGRLAAAMSVAADTAFDPHTLALRAIELAADARRIDFSMQDRRFTCTLPSYACAVGDTAQVVPSHHVTSPDGQWEAFIHEYDLWIRGTDQGDSVRLTDDGEEYFQYGQSAPRANQQISGNRPTPVLEWAPDSRSIAVQRMDEREVDFMALYSSTHQRPRYYLFKYAVAGDSVVPAFDIHVVDVESMANRRVDLPPQPSYSGFGGVSDGDWQTVFWGPDGSSLHALHTVRGRKSVSLHEVDVASGSAGPPIVTDSADTFVELNLTRSGDPNVWVAAGGDEIIWFSERDGWAHLYLHDGAGGLKNRITAGPWTVGDLLRVDATSRTIWFTARGIDPDINPYFSQLYRIGFDGSAMQRLTPEIADHVVTFTPSGRHFVDRSSTPADPGRTVLRRASDGTVVLELEEGDVSAAEAIGWRPPEVFTVKARDGVTDLWGLMFRPAGVPETGKSPVIVNLYPGPQIGSVRTWGFDVGSRGELHALSRLGFVVLQVDALGTPYRSKWFHTFYHGDMGDNGIDDQVAMVKQMGARHDFLDLGRVGIFGHSGGGFSSTGALLRHPDFFKVAVSGAGNHDNRSYSHHWGEQYHDLMERDTLRSSDNYESQANPLLAGQLKGKLLLMHGDMDDNVHPAMTIQLVDALIKANKSFDLIIAPNRAHGLNEPYFIRRRWDYFVEHLMGADPPHDYLIRRPEN